MQERLKYSINAALFFFLLYTVILVLSTFFQLVLFSVPKIFLGLAIFFLSGCNVALFFSKVFKISFDNWEFLTLGVFLSFFIIPVVSYLFFLFFGFITEISIICLLASLSILTLIGSFLIERNGSQKI